MRDVLPIIGMVLVALLMGFVFGVDFGDWRVKREAVEKGIAEYYLDANFEKKWRWKERP